MAVGVASLGAFRSTSAAQLDAEKSPDQILAELKAGNDRFSSGKTNLSPRTPEDFARDAQGQAPPAIVLGCADSRVPPEIVFDQPVGDLFTLRVAGNIVGSGPILLGSIEFAVAELGAKLIVVMGHSSCGACAAAIEHIENNDALPGAIEGMVNYIRPVVRQVQGKPGDKLVNVTKQNAIYNAQKLRKLGPILPDLVKSGTVQTVAAYYELSTGKVEFLDS
ncbi:carbonic anhydrase [Blastopirellula retiformator]|nr:carbonic anhydrase [Blastopirellula retiformator]